LRGRQGNNAGRSEQTHLGAGDLVAFGVDAEAGSQYGVLAGQSRQAQGEEGAKTSHISIDARTWGGVQTGTMFSAIIEPFPL
jgi:hypothetical protein